MPDYVAASHDGRPDVLLHAETRQTGRAWTALVIWWAVAVAGAAGAACRYLVDFAVTARSARSFPLGTVAVNVSGALLIGVVAGLVAGRGAPASLRLVMGAGFVGSYTTFSTLMYESWRLLEDGAYGRAAANLGSILVGMVAAALGWALAGP